MNRRKFILGSAFSVFLPWVGRPEEEPKPEPQLPEPIYLPVPDFVPFISSTNPQMYRNSIDGVIFACTRTDSSIGSVVWRVDGYQDRDHPGTPTELFLPEDARIHFANSELAIWPDGRLWYVTTEVNNLQERRGIAQTAYPVPGWTV